MQDPNVRDREPSTAPSWKIIAGLVAAVVLVGGGAAVWTMNSANAPGTNPVESTDGTAVNPSDPSETAVPQEAMIQAYVLEIDGNSFKLVPASVPTSSTEPAEQLKDSFKYILSPDQVETGFSEIPAGTKLLNLTIEDDGVHVDLSSQFTQGGGSASMTGRLGQVVYTASSLDPTASVWISVDGKPLEVLGGEGLMVDQPMTRASFDQNFPL
ncbi:MAG: GerMN domain-containing protein [Synechococcales cyanobacterium T60_A2020_003]|nr:GerMN domain-containing protein [Synechococcales cyanobacterium T60_A2020_003]